MILLREKNLSEQEYTIFAQQCQKICEKYGVPLGVNSFSQAARKVGAQYLQVPFPILLEHSGSWANIQRLGVSVHSVEEARRAAGLGAGYLIAGHIFATDCKRGVPPRGLDFLNGVCSAVSLPVFAIGGICAENIQEVLEAGAAGVCIMSKLMTCGDPFKEIERYRRVIPPFPIIR